jgi:hypothetical protein
VHPQRHAVGGRNKARDKRRVRAIVDLFGSTDLRGASFIENDDAIGHRHGLLPILSDMRGSDSERLLRRLDPVL